MQNALFFKLKKIPENSTIFHQLKTKKLFFSYFLADEKYYIFFYKEESIDLEVLRDLDIIEKIDSKKRQIRSLRGYIIYVLEIMEKAENFEILSTNLQPFFWEEVARIIRQNKKAGLEEFLFEREKNNLTIFPSRDIERKLSKFEKRIQKLEESLTRGSFNTPKSIKPFKEEENTVNQKPIESSLVFKTIKEIPNEEFAEIIREGFSLQTENEITLKEYYEGEGEFTLFSFKNFKMKYDSVRRAAIYKKEKKLL